MAMELVYSLAALASILDETTTKVTASLLMSQLML